MSTDPRKQALWRARLGSAFRTVFACSIVGCTTLYGPRSVQEVVAFPAFSYVTTILIVSDATLGDALRGCWHALYASVQVMVPSVLSLWAIGPERFTGGLAAVAVAMSAFVVALPESTNLMAKRIAFGQLVIVYVGTVIRGGETGVVMHPIRVASSTVLGAFASLVAMLLPFPRLAFWEVRKTCRLYAENTSERLNLFVEAFCAQDNTTALDFISQAKCLSKTGSKHLQFVKEKQEAMLWERPQLRLLKHKCPDPGEKLQEMETAIRWMEIALSSCHSFPVGIVNEEIKNGLLSLKTQIGLKLEQTKWSVPSNATTAPETKGGVLDKSLLTLESICTTPQDLPAFFFLYCMELLQDDSSIAQKPEYIAENTRNRNTEEPTDTKDQVRCGLKKAWLCDPIEQWCSERLVFAFKCSISLGLAVLFGLTYNKENGYWSGLTIAISFVTGRQPTFTVANARAQGTAMGSVYGILCCFFLQSFMDLRFLPLLPWIIFTSFLRHSQMYGQAGGISAIIGALLILGRKFYGPPNEFAIARITEATIGLICFITVEILLHPSRAATLAKAQLSQSLEALQDCIQDLVLCVGQNNKAAPLFLELREKHIRLKSCISGLDNSIAEAEMEPNFWFLPFHGACYAKLLGSLSKLVDLLLFAANQSEYLSQASQRFGETWKELQEHMNDDLEDFKEKVCFSLKCLREVTLIKSLAALEKQLQKRNVSLDIELGRSANTDAYTNLFPLNGEGEEIVSNFLQHSQEVANRINANQEKEKLKRQMVFCLSSLGFCLSSLIRETMAIETEIKELVKWENPTRNINLYEIYCNINALRTK